MVNTKLIEYMYKVKRDVSSTEHMMFSTYKYNKTSETLRELMLSILRTYEDFLKMSFEYFEIENTDKKIQEAIFQYSNLGIDIDISDYYLIKNLLQCDYICKSEYRKHVCMLFFYNNNEYTLDIKQIHSMYNNLLEKGITSKVLSLINQSVRENFHIKND